MIGAYRQPVSDSAALSIPSPHGRHRACTRGGYLRKVLLPAMIPGGSCLVGLVVGGVAVLPGLVTLIDSCSCVRRSDRCSAGRRKITAPALATPSARILPQT